MRTGRRLCAVVVIIGLVSCSATAEELPPDLMAVVDTATEEMISVLPEFADCIANTTIEHAWELEDRAHYLPENEKVVLRVPATEGQLRVSIVHELAHHVDLGCEMVPRQDFLLAQGLSPDVPWNEGPSWEETPSEQFAVAVALVVTGSNDPLRPITINEATQELIRSWGAGSGLLQSGS